MSRRLSRIITGSACALSVLCLWAGFGGLAQTGTEASVTMAEWTPDLKSPDLEGEPILANKSFPETLARPLFSPTRKPPGMRPPEPVAAAPPQAPEPTPPQIQALSPDGFVLKGIFLDDERRLALLQTPASPQGVWLATGAEVEGWRVSRIDKQRIAIEANGRTQELTLYVDKQAN